MMQRTRSMFIGCLLLALSACGEAPSAEAPPAVEQIAERFSAGQRHLYDFEWTVEATADNTSIMPGGLPMKGAVRMKGKLSMRVYGETGAGIVLGLSWPELDRHEVRVLGEDVLTDPTAIVAREAFLLVPRDGDARKVFFDNEAPSVFRHLMSGMLAHTDLRLPEADADQWSRVAPTGNGLAHIEYQRDRTDGRRLNKTFSRYLRLDAMPGLVTLGDRTVDGKATIVLDEAGVPTRIESEELLLVPAHEESPGLVSRTTFDLVRERVEADAQAQSMPSLADLRELDLHEPPNDEEAERQMARKFAEDLSSVDMMITVQSVGRGLPPAPGFMMKVTGLLRGWPELAEQLVPEFETAPNTWQREFVVDLLVSASTPESQHVLRGLLEGRRGADDYARILQHLALLERPTAEIGQHLLESHALASDEGDDVVRTAALHPMGSIAKRVASSDPWLSEALLARIHGDLEAAREPWQLVGALAGIGNAGRPDDLPVLLAYRDHEDIDVRTQVASSLRDHVTDEATDMLFELLEDEDRLVASQALTVLDNYHLPEGPAPRLAGAVLAGAHHHDLTGPLVSVLAARRRGDAGSRAALRSLAVRTQDRRQQLRIGRLLRADEA